MRLLATCLTALMVLPLPPAEADQPATVDLPAADTRAVIEDGKSLLQQATELCGTAGFAGGTAENRACAADFFEALATSLTPTKVPPERQVHFAEGSNFGLTAASCLSDHTLPPRRSVNSPEFLLWIDADGLARAVFIEVPTKIPRLDNETSKCIRRLGSFVPRIIDGKPTGTWQHMKWTWKVVDSRPTPI